MRMDYNTLFADRVPVDYVPEELPCGLKINRYWRPGKPLECCRVSCPYPEIRASNDNIETCYGWYKKGRKGADPLADLRVESFTEVGIYDEFCIED